LNRCIQWNRAPAALSGTRCQCVLCVPDRMRAGGGPVIKWSNATGSVAFKWLFSAGPAARAAHWLAMHGNMRAGRGLPQRPKLHCGGMHPASQHAQQWRGAVGLQVHIGHRPGREQRCPGAEGCTGHCGGMYRPLSASRGPVGSVQAALRRVQWQQSGRCAGCSSSGSRAGAHACSHAQSRAVTRSYVQPHETERYSGAACDGQWR
jgi:hypothetical protein